MYPMLVRLIASSLFCRLALTRIFRCRNRFTMRNSSVSERVAVTPLAISHMPKSGCLSTFPVNASSKQMNSQHELPIWNDLHAWGGVHRTALQPFACPLSQIHNLKKKCFIEKKISCKFEQKKWIEMIAKFGQVVQCSPANIRSRYVVTTLFDCLTMHVMTLAH